jgi:hypothetical protein
MPREAGWPCAPQHGIGLRLAAARVHEDNSRRGFWQVRRLFISGWTKALTRVVAIQLLWVLFVKVPVPLQNFESREDNHAGNSKKEDRRNRMQNSAQEKRGRQRRRRNARNLDFSCQRLKLVAFLDVIFARRFHTRERCGSSGVRTL